MKKTFEKIEEKTEEKKQFVPSNSSGKSLSLFASVFLLMMTLFFCFDPTMRLIRVCLNGDGIERLKCDFTVDSVKTKWAYACWSGNYPTREDSQKFGCNYEYLSFETVKLPLLNQNIGEGPLNINGQTFSQGIGSHAPSKIAFDLQGKYARFSCKVGLDIMSKSDYNNHGVVFTLIADGKEIYRSPKLGLDADPFPIDCSVVGVKELVLFADNLRFDDALSNVDWVDLKFDPQIHL